MYQVLEGATRHSFQMCSIQGWASIPGLRASEAVATAHEEIGDPIAALLDKRIHCVEFCGPAGARQAIVDAPRAHAVVLPGSFNPLHEGHMCGGPSNKGAKPGVHVN